MKADSTQIITIQDEVIPFHFTLKYVDHFLMHLTGVAFAMHWLRQELRIVRLLVAGTHASANGVDAADAADAGPLTQTNCFTIICRYFRYRLQQVHETSIIMYQRTQVS